MEKFVIERVEPVKLDLDFECSLDIQSGKGIRLQSVESFRKNEKVFDGLQSQFFGSDYVDDLEYAQRWKCPCGKRVGYMYQGTTCPVCGGKVEYTDVDLSKFGWIICDHFKLMSPIFAMKLQEALGTVDGEKVLNRILKTEFGGIEDKSPLQIEKEIELKKKHPFIGKGMRWLTQNLKEVLDYYEEKKPTKANVFRELREDIDKVFTHSIPVFSSVLRIEAPGEKDQKLLKLRINTIYLALIRTTNCINEIGDPKSMTEEEFDAVDRYLFQAHKDVINIFDEIFNILDGKKGVIAGRVLAGRYNFSSRMVISASSGELRADEVEVSYIAFMELFRYEILQTYHRIMHCTYNEAQNAWKRALTHFDRIFYNIMQTMCEKERKNINIMINRNPSINHGSFLMMKIKRVNPNIRNKTMRLNTRVIKTMAADYDGDQLNVYRVIGEDLAKRFSKNMNPRYNLYINHINGRCNRDLLAIKDETVGFWAFNSL